MHAYMLLHFNILTSDQDHVKEFEACLLYVVLPVSKWLNMYYNVETNFGLVSGFKYLYIYIYMCVCVCVNVCMYSQVRAVVSVCGFYPPSP